jgi:hypothetical protein
MASASGSLSMSISGGGPNPNFFSRRTLEGRRTDSDFVLAELQKCMYLFAAYRDLASIQTRYYFSPFHRSLLLSRHAGDSKCSQCRGEASHAHVRLVIVVVECIRQREDREE